MPDKDLAAERLIAWHFRVEPGLVRVYRVLNDREDDPAEPIKLLEVNAQGLATGQFTAFGFAPTSDVPFATLIAEVTPSELEELLRAGRLPVGWNLETARAYERPAA